VINQPIIHPSSDEDWKNYYNRKYNETDKQLSYLAWAFSHVLRFALEGKPEDAHTMGRRVARRLTYPRDKDPILVELAKHPEFAGSILRDENS